MPESSVIRLLRLVWASQGKATDRSWRELNRVMAEALSLAISGGFQFGRGDFAIIDARDGGFNFAYWARTDRNGYGERFYSLACGVGRHGVGEPHLPNVSACIAYERWKDRKPFFLGQDGASVKHRLCIGFRLYWQDQWIYITGIAGDGESLTACSYHEAENPADYRRRIKHRLIMSRETLARIGRALEAERSSASDAASRRTGNRT